MGVPVPKDLPGLSDGEYKNKVFCAWFDACIYVSTTKRHTDGDDLQGSLGKRLVSKHPESAIPASSGTSSLSPITTTCSKPGQPLRAGKSNSAMQARRCSARP